MSTGPTNPAIAAIWQRQLSQTRERIALLRKAADQVTSTRTLDPALHTEARDTAHKLAGSLGMFGFHEATDHARAIEEELDRPGLPQPERLDEHVTALEAALIAALA